MDIWALTVELILLLVGVLFMVLASVTKPQYKNRIIILRTCGVVFICWAILHSLSPILE